MSSDVIGDMLVSLKNASLLYKEKIEIPFSKMKYEIARVLKEEGLISNYKKVDATNRSYLRIFLKYGPNKERLINDIGRVSKPGRRIYCGYKELKTDEFTLYILSTPKGIMSDKEAKKNKVGGEVICYVKL